jgi:nucleotide-binding universal stress UspA family protein
MDCHHFQEVIMSVSHPTPARAARKRIVVGIDGSDCSIDALRTAVTMADALDCELEVVMCWHAPISAGPGFGSLDWNPQLDCDKILTNVVDRVFGPHRPVGLRMTTVEGPPAGVLVKRSQGAEMLVVGTRGHGGFLGLLLGSVSAHCAEHASCPVLVVRDQRSSPRVAPSS